MPGTDLLRICYFIQNHRAAPQLARLIGTLRRFQADALILVGHDELAGLASADEIRRAVEADVFALREPGQRGYFSLIQPYFDALEWLARQDASYDWIVYLSGQDYPVQSLKRFEARLLAGDADGFLRFWEAWNPDNPWGRASQGIHRYGYQYRDARGWSREALRLLRSLNGIQKRMHVHLTYGPRIGRRRPAPFGPGLVCYGGRQWTTLSRACAEHVLEESRARPDLMEWFRCTLCPDEAVVQTLLANGARFRLVDDDLRYVDFAGERRGHPRTLTVADLPEITRGPYYFGRKLDLETDPELFDRLDSWIDGSGD